MTNDNSRTLGEALSENISVKGKSIDFTVDPSGLYVIAEYVRPLDDESLISDYKLFFNSGIWSHGMHEFVDLQNTSILNLSEQGLINLGKYIEDQFQTRNIEEYYSAIYAPNPLPFGLARMYQTLTDGNDEVIQIFRDYDIAKEWLLNKCGASGS